MTLEEIILSIQSEVMKRAEHIKYFNTPLAFNEFANIFEQVIMEFDKH